MAREDRSEPDAERKFITDLVVAGHDDDIAGALAVGREMQVLDRPALVEWVECSAGAARRMVRVAPGVLLQLETNCSREGPHRDGPFRVELGLICYARLRCRQRRAPMPARPVPSSSIEVGSGTAVASASANWNERMARSARPN